MALTKVTGDFIKDGVLTQAHLHTSHGITTAHIGEGSNLYFTNARVASYLSSNNYVSGTGTNNRLAIWNGTGVIDSDSDFYVDGDTIFTTNLEASGSLSVSGGGTFTGGITVSSPGSSFYTTFKSANDYVIGLKDSANTTQWWLKAFTNGSFALHEDSVGDKFTIAAGGNATFAGDLTVSGGDITLGGTGRIQGIDTVSAGTDAANKTYVDNQVAGIVDSAPSTLDTLNELAAALGDDANFSTTVTNSIATKMPLAGGTFTGAVVGTSFSAPSGFINGSNGGIRIHSSGTKFFNITAANAARDGVMDIGAPDARFKDLYLSGNITAGGNVTASSGTGHFSLVNASGYQLNGTYVMDSSRNLVNIANITASGAAGDGTPLLTLTGSASATFNWISKSLHANLTAGETNLHLFGKAASSKNSGYIGYNWAADASNNNYVSIGHYSANHLFRIYGDQVLSTVTLRSDVDMQAPIFYDKNNTSYYLHPDSSSNLLALVVQDNLFMNAGQLYIGAANGTTDDSYRMYESSGEFIWQSRESGTWTTRFSISNGGAIYSHLDHRAPIFYDSNDTGYYANPAGTSNFYNIETKYYGETGTGVPTYDEGGIEVITNSNGVPAIGFHRGGYSATTLYEYDGELYVNPWTTRAQAGKLVSTGNISSIIYSGTWMGANFAGTRFAGYSTDGGEIAFLKNNPSSGKNSILVDGSYYAGENGGFWSIWSGNNYNNRVGIYGDSSGNLNIGTSTSENVLRTNFGYIQMGPMNSSHAHIYTDRANFYLNKPLYVLGSSLINQNDIRTQILYDANDTSYYFEGNGTSRFHSIWCRGAAVNSAPRWDTSFHVAQSQHWYGHSSSQTMYLGESANTIQVPGSGGVRSQIFYDYNDTNYYVHPGDSTTSAKFRQFVNIGDSSSYSSNSGTWGARLNVVDNIHSRIDVGQDADGMLSSWYTHTGHSYSFFGTMTGHHQYFYSHNTLRLRLMNGYSEEQSSFRAPIFYDSNNTGYYLDPASTSFISNLTMNGNIEIRRTDPTVYFRDTDHNSAMIHVNSNTFYVLRGGNDTTTWTQVNSNWPLTINLTNNNATFGGNVIAVSDMRAPIFYDQNNTVYYSDPGGTSVANNHTLKGTISLPASGLTTHGSSHRPAYGIYQEGGSWSSPFPDLCIAMHTGIKLGANASYNGIRFYNDYTMATQVMAINDSSSPAGAGQVYVNDTFLAGGSVRGPIFYDSNNTTYYTRPSTYSYMNQIWTVGTIQAGSSGTGNIYLGNNGISGSGNHFRFHTNNSHTYFDGNCGDIHWRQGSSTRFYFYMTSANMTINGTLTQNSDERIKENIVEIPNALEKIDAMRGVYYNRTDINTEVKKIGVIAQEVEAVLPEVILEAPDTGLKSVAYAELTAVLVQAIKEQQTIIDDLKSRIETLENQ